jgi:hypothetical protein
MTDFSTVHLLLLCYSIAWVFNLLPIILFITLINYIYRLYYNQQQVRAFRYTSDINTCAICLETNRERGIKLSCGHTFHEKCILDWRRINPVCPLCRCKM